MLKLLLIWAAIFISLPQAANAQYYLTGSIGWDSPRDADYTEPGLRGNIELDSTLSYGAGVGRIFTPYIRAEIEISQREADLASIDTSDGGSAGLNGEFATRAFMLNGYYDFTRQKRWNPYLTAGLGFMDHDVEVDSIAGISLTGASADDTVLGYQIGGGLEFRYTRQARLFGDYRYFGSDDVEFDGSEMEYNAHEFRAGLRYDLD